ncbi:sigma-54 dependent transcriptional regulator [Geobacter sp. SVR]|uniref:sigma-54-dependent transcriptional regulator n=1 Tax=Geobacter sp. SVR TaxID=2495594 RepID=UPI00143EF6FF|nr:sigma-54 dependent transcriptional regulator [Geobacter sp. SVR]BCS53650.1 Fis family transcriptional regulator [Geobacter sp. SVR]GCF84153.1 Fis family transcriptional regulator [Geobacter sp. SVR]
MSQKKRILLIDNEAGLCRMMEQVLLDNGYLAKAFTDPRKALEEFLPNAWDLVITDIKMPGMSGLEVLQKVKEQSRDLPVMMITAYATVDMSIQALRKGAYDMLTKPFEPEELIYRVKNALQQSHLLEENRELRQELRGQFSFENIIGTSGGLKEVLGKVGKIAVRDTSVLITGESGSGKELIAQAIHYNSPRHERKFVAINCAALPETLLESELFGYKKGAFTGAKENRQGLLEAADGGTFFLDEVGNLPMNVQKTLLRFLQEKEFIRLGDTTPTRVDVRLLSATNADLKQAVKDGTFREDLFYRLNVVNIHLPSLRERTEDIPQLAAHFIRLQNQKFGTSVKGFEREAMQVLCEYDWPGNIRQLRNVIEACMAMVGAGEDFICRETLDQFIDTDGAPRENIPVAAAGASELPFNAALERFEADLLRSLLKRHGGNIDSAAREAGMNMATMYRKIKKHGIKREEYL